MEHLFSVALCVFNVPCNCRLQLLFLSSDLLFETKLFAITVWSVYFVTYKYTLFMFAAKSASVLFSHDTPNYGHHILRFHWLLLVLSNACSACYQRNVCQPIFHGSGIKSMWYKQRWRIPLLRKLELLISILKNVRRESHLLNFA